MEPKIYFPEDHGLDQDLIDPDALFILKKLRDAGFTAYLVGGSVRDILARVKPKDFDISTSALPEEIKKIFRKNCILIGRRFRLAHIRFGRKIFEVSTFRAGETDEADLIVRDNVWGTAEEDARRRDFSINGLFYDPYHKTVIDYVDGWHDLKEGVLRSIGNPEVRFKQDPVRMIRLLKFHARFDLKMEPGCVKALKSCREEIVKSAPARILEELLRMLESGHGHDFFKLLSEYQLLDLLIPELDQFLRSENGSQVYEFLKTADLIHHKNENVTLERSLLISCILFPIVERQIADFCETHDKTPNFGELSVLVWSVIRETMTSAFTHFPRKISAISAYIIITQYRLTPFGKRRSHRSKFLHDKDFPLALRFLRIRALADNQYSDKFFEWENMYYQIKKHHGDKKPKYVSQKRRKPKRKSAQSNS
ncbi:MAG: Poly(A) polymerase I [Chlamydiae bacterium]|nr:Poly(A) polymerase I [Chlamydiota bacterium]